MSRRWDQFICRRSELENGVISSIHQDGSLSGLEPAKLEYFDSDEKQAVLSVDTIREVEHALLSTSEAAELSSEMLIHLNQLLGEPSSGHGRPIRFIAWIQHVVSR